MPSKPVTVDSDDLEALIQAANVTVMLERAISAAKQDVIYQRTRDSFSDASARVQKARNAALRTPSPHESEPMTAGEFEWLRGRQKGHSFDEGFPVDPGPDAPIFLTARSDIGIVDNPTDPTCDMLRKKRLIETGNKQTFISWGQTPEQIGLPEMAFRLTARGDAEFERIERARRAAIKPYDLKPPVVP